MGSILTSFGNKKGLAGKIYSIPRLREVYYISILFIDSSADQELGGCKECLGDPFTCKRMNTKPKTSARGPEFFSSDNFLIQLKFEDDGSIEGWVIHYPIGLNLAARFQAICIEEENGLIQFSFFIEWSNPNLSGKVLTAYSGEIVKSQGAATSMVLEWLQISEKQAGLGIHPYQGYEVLSGLREKDYIRQASRPFFRGLGKSVKRL